MKIETEVLVERFRDNLFSVAFNVCGNAADAEDVVQETFLRYHTTSKQFDSEAHIRAWLLRVSINKAKNVNRAFRRRPVVPLEDYMESLSFESQGAQDLFEQVMKLPEKYRVVLHLFYYEDYAVREIAKILGESESNVKTRLSRARKLLKNYLKEEWNDDE